VVFLFSNDALQVQSLIQGGSLQWRLKMTNGDTPYIKLTEWVGVPNLTKFEVNPGIAGARISVNGDNGEAIGIAAQGSGSGNTFLRMQETTNNPSSVNGAMQVYLKGGKIVVQYVDAGTTRYKYLDLTGTGVTWTHTTVAP